MAREFRSFTVTVPAGTTAAAPQLSPLTMPPRIVTGVRIRVPPGPRGMVGFALAVAGQPIIPWNAGAWVIADDEVMDWPLHDQIESGAWQLAAYNTGIYAHSVYLTFYLEPVGSLQAGGIAAPLTLTA